MSRRDQLLRAFAFVACIALAIGRLPEVMETPISAADDLHPLVYPLLADEGLWRISHGYNGGGRSAGDYQQFSLDFAAESTDSAGRTVVAPASGKVNWIDPGGVRWSAKASNCMSIKIDGDGSHYVVVCHVWFDRVYNVGDRVSRGERIGVIGPKDDSSPFRHVQVTLYTAPSDQQAGLPSGRRAAPFIEPWSLSGCDYSNDGRGLPQYEGETGLPERCPSTIPLPDPSPTSAMTPRVP